MRLIFGYILGSLAAFSTASGLDDAPSQDSEVQLVHEPALSNFQIYNVPVAMAHAAGSKRSEDLNLKDKTDMALVYLRDHHQIDQESVQITSAYTNEDTGISHIYVRQTVGGVDVVNGVGNINIDKGGRVISSSHSFAPIHRVRRAARSGYPLTARTTQDESLKAAINSLCKYVGTEIQGGELEDVRIVKAVPPESGFVIEGLPQTAAVDGTATAKEAMMQKADGSVVRVWDIVLEQQMHWWTARMNMATGDVESLNDWVSRSQNTQQTGLESEKKSDGSGSLQSHEKRATYHVIPHNKNDPTDGFVNVVNPEDTIASPVGWLSDGNRNYTATIGNNVIAFHGTTDGTTQQTSPNQFLYNLNPSTSPTTPSNLDVSRTQLFYDINSLHDLFYRYGFTERAFNFQKNNFNKGGLQNDQVFASTQDNSAVNEVIMTTPPDGQAPRLQVHLFNVTNPFRDAALSLDLIAGQYTLGVVTRMIGGGTATCLRTLESAGLGVGFGDAVADWILSKSAVLGDFRLGAWLSNNPRGIRSFPYSTNPQVNPLKYDNIFRMNDTYSIGAVWANILHNTLATFMAQYGWRPNAFTSPEGGEGNVRFMHLLVDSLALSPCNPNFIHMRNAFIQADNNRYQGAHFCILWKVFASRGLGYSARPGVNGFDVPQRC